MNCPNYKTIEIPACFSGNLIIKTGLDEGTQLYSFIHNDFTTAFRDVEVNATGEALISKNLFNATVSYFSNVEVNATGEALISKNLFNATVSYFSNGILKFAERESQNFIPLFSFDGYKLKPYRNTDPVQDVIIDELQRVTTTEPETT